jgi:quinol-cytochrome oxidoreductase complex cytochrome b subunit
MKNNKDSLFSVALNHLVNYPTPLNFNYFFGYGSLSILCLVVQLLSGVLLAMHYIPSEDLAFMSVEHIMRDVQNGWLLRYTHANGASMFFICLYIHMLRSLYYGSFIYPRHYTWVTGSFIFVLTIATAFLGYVLPWGQMSFWAATVITNLFSAIPFIGVSVVEWLWGGFSVSNPTLNRFFALHFLLPFLILGLVGLHIAFVHKGGSNNPLSIESPENSIPFYSYFFIKDLLGVEVFFLIFSLLIYGAPDLLGHPDNYIYADELVTPAHIIPEWYFLPLYAILRTVPKKVHGVICMGSALITIILLPFLFSIKTRGCTFFFKNKLWFWAFLNNGFFLGWLGQKEMATPYLEIGVYSTSVFFLTTLFSLSRS